MTCSTCHGACYLDTSGDCTRPREVCCGSCDEVCAGCGGAGEVEDEDEE